jgi:site-specific DNA-methyltransferase (adenine-specific)
MTPAYQDAHVTLYAGDARDLAPAIGPIDAIVTDPPYGEINFKWDHWPAGWPGWFDAPQLWCFTSLRLQLRTAPEFEAEGWSFVQEIVWEKPNGSNAAVNRFRRVHELLVHWYCGPWNRLQLESPRSPAELGQKVTGGIRRNGKPKHWHGIGSTGYQYAATRIARSVQRHPSERHRNWHPTQKPLELLRRIITYSVRPGGIIVDPFAGSGSTLIAAAQTGRRAIGIERSPEYLARAIQRLQQAARGEPDLRPVTR